MPFGPLALDGSAGLGEIYSWTVVHRPVTAEFEPPYAPAIVKLDEGYQMLTNIVGVASEELRSACACGSSSMPSDPT